MPPKANNKRFLDETDHAAAPAAKRPSPVPPAAGANGNGNGNDNSNTSASATTCPLKFVTQPRPPFDFRLEHDQEKEEEAEIQKAWDELRKSVRAYDRKPAADFPDYTWKISTKSIKLLHRYMIQTQKRDQDRFGCYFYNDFTGYGIQEVAENQLLEWKNEFTKKEASPYMLWASMECFAFWLSDTDMICQWLGLEDGQRLGETLAILGRALLATLHALEGVDLLKKDSPIPNIPLILSLFLLFIRDGEDGLSMTDFPHWPNAVVAYAEKHSIEIKGAYGITNTIYSSESLDEETLKRVNQKGGPADKWEFSTEWTVFTKRHGYRSGKVGGNYMDILKMTKRERIEASFNKKDPVAKMPKAPPEEVETDAEDDEWEDVDDDSENSDD